MALLFIKQLYHVHFDFHAFCVQSLVEEFLHYAQFGSAYRQLNSVQHLDYDALRSKFFFESEEPVNHY